MDQINPLRDLTPPNPPVNLSPEMDRYLQELNSWFRALVDQLTSDNLLLQFPDVPDKTLNYRLWWNSSTKKIEWNAV